MLLVSLDLLRNLKKGDVVNLILISVLCVMHILMSSSRFELVDHIKCLLRMVK